MDLDLNPEMVLGPPGTHAPSCLSVNRESKYRLLGDRKVEGVHRIMPGEVDTEKAQLSFPAILSLPPPPSHLGFTFDL